MSSTPFMQFYVGDYLAKTADLTTEQHGAYLLILMTMWQNDAKLPADEKKLARIARMTPAKFRAVWAEISRFFDEEDGVITNQRLTKERKKAAEKSSKRAAAGSAGGKAKALKDNEVRVANAMPLPQHSSDTRVQIKKEDTNVSLSAEPTLPAMPPKDAGPSFPDFWAVWPLGKISKQAAEKAWRKLSIADRRMAIDRAQVWSAHWRHNHPQANPIHPASYLNGKRWTDEIQATLTVIPGGPHAPSHQDRRAAASTDTLRNQLNDAGRMRRSSEPDWI